MYHSLANEIEEDDAWTQGRLADGRLWYTCNDWGHEETIELKIRMQQIQVAPPAPTIGGGRWRGLERIAYAGPGEDEYEGDHGYERQRAAEHLLQDPQSVGLVTDELREDEEMIEAVKDLIKQDQEDDLREELKEEIREEFEEEMREEIKEEMREEETDDIRDEVREEVKEDELSKLQNAVVDEVKAADDGR